MFHLLVAIGLTSSVLANTPLAASAGELEDERARLAIINRLKDSLSDNLQRAEAQEIALEQQLQITRDTINQTVDQIAATERRISELVSQIAALEAKIAETRLQLAKAKGDYGSFLRVTYKSQGEVLSLLLKSPDFQAFLSRAVVIQRVSWIGQDLIARIKRTERELHAEEDQVKTRKQEADAERANLVDQKAGLEREQAKEKDLLARLRISIAQVRYELVVIKGQSAALAQRIVDMEIARQNQIIAEAEQAAWQQAQFWMAHNLFSLPSANAKHSTKYPLIWPLQQGSLSLLFGPTTYLFEPPGFGYPHFHTGVDIAYTQGTPILAADDGVVVAADKSMLNGVLVGYGNYVIVAHRNNFFSLYAHLLKAQVNAGDTVQQGQVLGFEGSTGNSTGPHLHLEYRYGGQPTNPLPYLPPNGPNDFSQ